MCICARSSGHKMSVTAGYGQLIQTRRSNPRNAPLSIWVTRRSGANGGFWRARRRVDGGFARH
jgi:hypothetical protein